jgi:hypothetical protein
LTGGGDRYGVADGDVVVAEEYLAHDESNDLLALLGREVLGIG